MNQPQPIQSKALEIGDFSNLCANLRKVAERCKKELKPKSSGIIQTAMYQEDFDRLMEMRDIIDLYNSQVDQMGEADSELINKHLGTLEMHLDCARDCIDSIYEVITA